MATVSIWQRAHQEADVACDVAIVGGGIVGASTAYWLSRIEPHARIVLLDAADPAAGASGRNAGFLLQGATSDYATDRARYGDERSRRLWLFTKETRDLLVRHADRRAIGLETSGSLVVAATEAEDLRLQQSVQPLRADGHAVSYLPASEVSRRIGGEGFFGGLYVTTGGALDPVALVYHLIEKSGVEVLTGHRAADLSASGRRLIVETGRRRVFAERVVLAMGAYLPRLVPALGKFVRPVRAQMLATEAQPSRWLTMPVYSHEGFFYLRQLADRHVIIGGARHLHERGEVGYDDHTTPLLQHDLERYLHAHFPQTRGTRVVRRWAGTMGFSPDGLPVAGQVAGSDEAYFATGFTGHGMAYGFRFGRMMAEWVNGDPAPPYLDLFSAARFDALQ